MEFTRNNDEPVQEKHRIKYNYEGKFDPNTLRPYSIDAQSVALIEKNKRVLEIGCATGFMSEHFTQQLKCTVIGVEINPEQAEQAKKKCHNILIGNIEDDRTLLEVKKKSQALGGIDIIFASSILEHLTDPKKVLIELREIIVKDGFIVVTLPNVAHWSIRKNLLLGKFDYEEYGIMDNTHLRFFTIKTGRRLIEQAGYKIVYFSVEPSDFYLIPFLKRLSIFGLLWRIKPDMAKAYMLKFSRLIGYQMLFKAVKL